MNVMALLAHKYADVGPIDKARYSEPMLQLAAAIGADGQFGVHYSTLICAARVRAINPDNHWFRRATSSLPRPPRLEAC